LETRSASCDAEGKSWDGFGIRLTNNRCGCAGSTASVLEIPLARPRIAGKSTGDEQISRVMWGCSEELLEEKDRDG